jgi:hypothetical protein
MGFSGDVWALVFLALVLKVPLLILVWVLWRAFRAQEREHPGGPPAVARMALCAYCGSRITVGYDAALVHGQATRIAGRTGEATFDVETRLIRATVMQPRHYAIEPDHCPDCGEPTVWVPIEPIDLSGHVATPGRAG